MNRGLVLALVLVAFACTGSSDPRFLARAQASGLQPRDFHAAQARFGSTDCQSGWIDELAVTICSLESSDAAIAAASADVAEFHLATGALLAAGREVLLVVDVRGVDGDGRRLNAVAKAFAGSAH